MAKLVVKEFHNEVKGGEGLPSFIYNRFDLFASDYYVFEIESGARAHYVTGTILGHKAELGVWLLEISRYELDCLAKFIFKRHNNVKEILLVNSYVPLGYARRANHFRICLPGTVHELHKRLTHRGRYNIRRKIKDLGEGLKFLEYKSKNIPDGIIERYFQYKHSCYRRDYCLAPREYLNKYHVTDAYVLCMDDQILSVMFSCEQCEKVYLENMAYNPLYSKCSPGLILYDYYLTRLIERGKAELYLGGGCYDYKQRYGGIKERVYNCILFRNFFFCARFMCKRLMQKILTADHY